MPLIVSQGKNVTTQSKHAQMHWSGRQW